MAREDDALHFRDSIANNGMVYTEAQTINLISWLEHLSSVAPPDSMRKYAAETLLNLNWFLTQHREWFLCQRLVAAARAYCLPDDQILLHQIDMAQAGIYLYCNQTAKAGNLLIGANRFFQHTSDTVMWLKTCINLGLFYSKTNRPDKALTLYRKVLEVSQQNKYSLYYSIASKYAAGVEEDSVVDINIFRKALQVSFANGNSFLLASNYCDLANYYYRLGNLKEALANARKSLQYAKGDDEEEIKVEVFYLMAEIYRLQNDYVGAYRLSDDLNKLYRKKSGRLDITLYRHLNTADSLLSWVENNVPLEQLPESASTSSRAWIWWIVGGVLAMSAALLLWRHCRCGRPAEALTGTTVLTEDQQPVTSALDSRQEDAAAMLLVADSFNPMLDRIRAMLKDIPKSGNQETDTYLRNLQTFLLQTRLPDADNSFAHQLRVKDEEFVSRLSAAYPSLTKSDLRTALYIRHGMGVQQIAALAGMQTKSVNQSRYRLRKGLGLGQNESLETFLISY